MKASSPIQGSPTSTLALTVSVAAALACAACDVFLPGSTGVPFSTPGGTSSVITTTTASGSTSESTPDVVFGTSAIWDTTNGATPTATATPTPTDTGTPIPIYSPTTMSFSGPIAGLTAAASPVPEPRAQGRLESLAPRDALGSWPIPLGPGNYSIRLEAAFRTGVSLAIWLPGASAAWAGARFDDLAPGDHTLALRWSPDGSVTPVLDGRPGARQRPAPAPGAAGEPALLVLELLPGESAQGLAYDFD